MPQTNNLLPIHELFGYSETNLRQDNFSGEFHMLPSEIAELLEALGNVADGSVEQKELLDSIQPERFFRAVLLKKNDVKEYEKFLMAKLKEWSLLGTFSRDQIGRVFTHLNKECDLAFAQVNETYGANLTDKSWMRDHIGKFVYIKNKNLEHMASFFTMEQF
jgi:hypothetical protein